VLNFAQYESFAYVPFFPGAMLSPPPGHDKIRVTKGKLTEQDLLKALPNKNISSDQIAMVRILSTYAQDEEWIGFCSEELFEEKKAKRAKKKLRNKLDEYTELVKQRGYWENMLPTKLPSSISI